MDNLAAQSGATGEGTRPRAGGGQRATVMPEGGFQLECRQASQQLVMVKNGMKSHGMRAQKVPIGPKG